MTASPVQPVSAAMPSEEDVARVIYPYGFKLMDSGDLLASTEASRYRQAHESARAVLALFAPILAQKERRIREMAMQALADDQQLTASLDRALAAEAALAAERERCAKVAEGTKSYDDNLQRSAGCATTGQRIATAICSQEQP